MRLGKNKNAERLEIEISIRLTRPQAEALALAVDFKGIPGSIYCRGAIIDRLVAEGWIKHPAAIKHPELFRDDTAVQVNGG
jgi:hypothetical protein